MGVQMLTNLDAGASEGETTGAGRDLKFVTAERDGIIIGNDACELEAEHIVGAQATEGSAALLDGGPLAVG
jgi:hypothetical protein